MYTSSPHLQQGLGVSEALQAAAHSAATSGGSRYDVLCIRTLLILNFFLKTDKDIVVPLLEIFSYLLFNLKKRSPTLAGAAALQPLVLVLLRWGSLSALYLPAAFFNSLCFCYLDLVFQFRGKEKFCTRPFLFLIRTAAPPLLRNSRSVLLLLLLLQPPALPSRIFSCFV